MSERDDAYAFARIVLDATGAPIGLFRKDFARSLLRSTWHLEQPAMGTITGQESNMVIALLRRFGFDFLPYNFDFALPLMS